MKRRIECTLLAVSLALPLLGIGYLSLRRFYQIDEFVFVRAAWLFSLGEIPYLDFFDHHTPLFYILLSPVIALSPETPVAMTSARLFSLILLLLLLWVVWRFSRAFGGITGAWLAIISLVTLQTFVARALEIRPDLLASLFFVSAGWLLFDRSAVSSRRGLVAGVLVTAALLSTQKSAYYLWGFGLLWMVDLVRARGRKSGATPLTGSPMSFLAGLLTVAAGFALWLLLTGSMRPFYDQNISLALQWNVTDRSFPATRFLVPAFLETPLWFIFVGAGIAVALVAEPVRRRLSSDSWLVYSALAVPAALSLLLNPIPWPYNLLPVFAILSPIIALLPAWLRLRIESRWLSVATVSAVVALILLGYLGGFSRQARRSNDLQRRDVARVLELTSSTDSVFDNNGTYLFRPAAYEYWYHSNAMRGLMHEEFADEMILSIRDRQAAAWVVDMRYFELPRNVQSFLRQNYQRFDGPIYLPGRAFHVSSASEGSVRRTFEVIKPGDYFISTEAETPGGARFLVDGEVRVPHEPFPLGLGEHVIEAQMERPQEPFVLFVLWVPATGELWEPRPGEPSRVFSHSF